MDEEEAVRSKREPDPTKILWRSRACSQLGEMFTGWDTMNALNYRTGSGSDLAVSLPLK